MALARIVNEQSVENFDSTPDHCRVTSRNISTRSLTETRALSRRCAHGNDQQVEHFLAALDEVEMAVGNRDQTSRDRGYGVFMRVARWPVF